MNILIDLLPKAVEVDGSKYAINSDFRTGILLEMLMQDDEVTDTEKLELALNLYFKKVPRDVEKAIEQIIWFYKCGKDEDKSSNKNNKGKSVTQIYNFNYDDDYIYSAFLDQYNIDLQDIEYLHWWKFKAMFKSLKEDNMIVKIMGYRSTDLSKIKDKEQREHYKKMKSLYEIPKSKNEIEKISDIENALLNGGDISKIL
ncbi:MAG: bacteriophage Gp15 family protein [Clostridium sp.]